jgi:hypothetical protein
MRLGDADGAGATSSETAEVSSCAHDRGSPERSLRSQDSGSASE